MSKCINHWCKKLYDFFLVKGLLSLRQKSFQVRQSLLHLNVTLLDWFSLSFFLYQSVRALELNNVRVRVGLQLVQQLNFLYEYELVHLVLQYDFLDALALALLIFYFIYETVSMSDDVMLFKLLVQLFITIQKFDIFRLEHYENFLQYQNLVFIMSNHKFIVW